MEAAMFAQHNRIRGCEARLRRVPRHLVVSNPKQYRTKACRKRAVILKSTLGKAADCVGRGISIAP